MPMKHREKAHGWKAPTVATDAFKEEQGVSLFASLVRQNNQNSQNEPGMSFGINEPYCSGSGPDMVASGSLQTPIAREV